MRCPPTRLAFAIVVVLSCARSISFAAEPDSKAAAREHYQKGSKAFSLGEFKEAIEEYKKGFQLVDDPVFLYNIAQAYRLDNNPERALFFYRSYLSRRPRANNVKEVQTRIAELEKLTAEQAAAQKTPPTRTLPPERESGEAPATEEKPAPETTPTAAAAPPPVPAAAMPPAEPPAQPRRDGRTKKYAGIGLLAGGGAVVVVGVVMSVLARQAASQINADGRAGRMFNPALESSGRTYNVVGPVLDGVGGVAMVTGAVLLTLGVRDARGTTRAQLAPSGAPGKLGLAISGEF